MRVVGRRRQLEEGVGGRRGEKGGGGRKGECWGRIA